MEDEGRHAGQEGCGAWGVGRGVGGGGGGEKVGLDIITDPRLAPP